jgi:hypothetical protein
MTTLNKCRTLRSGACRPVVVGLCAAAMVFAWQAATVHFNYQGNWSSLYRIGDAWAQPPDLRAEANRVFANDPGYDGTFYHLIAHDPWLHRDFARYVDNPSLRWRRILVPAMAQLAALGADGRVHSAYIAVNLLFVFAGTFWLSRFCVRQRLAPAWGLLFPLAPSVLVSMDRLTIDTALSALTVGVVLYSITGNRGRMLGLLVLCPLARETGLAIVAGRGWADAVEKRWKLLALTLAAALPFLLWVVFVFTHTSRDATPWLSWPLAGIVHRTLHPPYAITGRWVAVAAVLDYAALAGMWLALILTAGLALKRRAGIIEYCAYAFAAGAVWLGKEDIWFGAYEFGRTMSPLLLLLLLLALRDRKPPFALPLVLVLPRIALQLQPQLLGILH